MRPTTLLGFGAWARASLGREPRSGRREARDLVVEVRRALDAEVVVLEVEPLVRRVRVLVGLAEAHEEARLAGRVRDRPDEGDAPALADEHGLAPERLAERAHCQVVDGMVGRCEGRPSWSGATRTRAPGGAMRSRCSTSLRVMSSGSWWGTSRQLTFARAVAGMIVFAPSPWKPPWMPQQSSVGRAQTRSSVEEPRSPAGA